MPTRLFRAVLTFLTFLLYLKPVLGSFVPTLLLLALFLAWGFVLTLALSSLATASRSQI
ncbi:MAG: hypothetical protein ACP5HQ_07000 [Thermoprotei archaeon]